MFWMPSVPQKPFRQDIDDRIAHDAYLLVGYLGDFENGAEELGIIKMAQSPEEWDDARRAKEKLDALLTWNPTGWVGSTFHDARSFVGELEARNAPR